MIKTIVTEFIEKLDNILAVGGATGTSIVYSATNSVGGVSFVSMMQCINTVVLAALAGITGWLTGRILKAIHRKLSKKKWYCKIFNIKTEINEK